MLHLQAAGCGQLERGGGGRGARGAAGLGQAAGGAAGVAEKVAETLLAQMGAGSATSGKEVGASEEKIHQWGMAMRKRDGNCLFVFAIEHSQALAASGHHPG